MRVVTVRADTDVAGEIHRCRTERAERPAGGDHLRDLLAEQVRAVKVDLYGHGRCIVFTGLSIGTDQDHASAVTIQAEREFRGLNFGAAREREDGGEVLVISRQLTDAVAFIAEGCFDRFAEGDELFLFQPNGGYRASVVHCTETEPALAGDSDGFGFDGRGGTEF